MSTQVKLGLLAVLVLFAVVHAAGAFMLAGVDGAQPRGPASLTHHGD
jgi:hypothetical protein